MSVLIMEVQIVKRGAGDYELRLRWLALRWQWMISKKSVGASLAETEIGCIVQCSGSTIRSSLHLQQTVPP